MDGLKIKWNKKFTNQEYLDAAKGKISCIHNKIHSEEEYEKMPLGWLDVPINTNKNMLRNIEEAANRLRNISDIIISLGIGGSYLGAKAAIEMLDTGTYKVIFAGNNISGAYLKNIIEKVKDLDFSLIVISKSGTTLETAISFRILKDILISKYGKEAGKERIVAITGKSKGILRDISEKEGYESFGIPDNIGGRYSVLTPAGLLTIAAAGIDIYEIMEGAKEAYSICSINDVEKNPAYKYAVLRNVFYKMGKTIEVLVSYEPAMLFLSEWWKQLFGESEGKEGRGIFPATLQFTRDLHSMGQYLQEGQKNIFETILYFKNSRDDVEIPFVSDNIDGLNYLGGKTLNYINKIAYKGVKEAHESGGVPVVTIDIPEITPYYFGYLAYFFQKACAVSGYLIDVNPFDQPGVEMYKRNIHRLLRG